MANFLKKFISGISVAAMLTATVVCPVMAENVYESWDYSADGAEADWTLGDNLTQSISDGMLYIINGSGSATRTASKNLENAVTEGDFTIEYAMKSYSRGDNASVITIGESSSDYLLELKFPKNGNSVTINGTSVSLSGASNYTTPIIYVKHTVLTESDTIKTEITYENGSEVYSGTGSYAVSNATDSVKTMVANLGKYNGLYLKNFNVSEYEATDEEKLEIAMKNIVISENQPGMTMEDDVYVVSRDVAIPTEPDGTELEWTLEQSEDGNEWSETTYAEISGGKLVLHADAASKNYLLRLIATVTCGGAEDSRTFYFRVKEVDTTETVVFYDEDFEGLATGNLVNLGSTSNTTYESSHAMTFTCGSRGEDQAQTGASIDSVDGGKSLKFYQNKYTGENRQPVLTLSKSNGATFLNNVVVKLAVKYAAASTVLTIKDSEGNTVSITAPSEDTVGSWINLELCKQGGKTLVLMRDAKGKIIDLYTDKVTLNDVKAISTTDNTYSYLYIDDLYIADEVYSVSNETIAEAGAELLKMDGEQTYLSGSGDTFTATGDFLIPDAPELTNVKWSAEQKAKNGGNWESSSFISASGLNAVINPTDKVSDYDVRLVAEVSCGEAEVKKYFTIVLPNPLDEIDAVLKSGYEVVESTDYTDANKTEKLTYNLKGGETLKYDIVLPTTVKGSKNCTIAWSVNESKYASLSGTTMSIMTDDLDEHDVTLTAVVTYKKGSIEYSSEPQSFTFKVGYTSEDAADTETYYKGKYKVRFDEAYKGNFSDIPDETTSSIELPTEGKFGSKITWSSSAPTVISNSGSVTRPSTDKTVKLTAAIISGAGSTEKTFNVKVSAKKTSGGGGGGGGSTSSTGSISNATGSTIASGNVIGSVNNTSAEDTVANLQEEAAASKDLFADITSAAWARDAINALASKGIVNGKSETEFAPNDTVTRAEFAKMLMGVFGLDSGAYKTSSFSDVSTDAWYFNSVETAYNLGIIQGVSEGKFAPNALITRQDMAVMVVRAANVCGVTLPEIEELIVFADEAQIADYAKSAVTALQRANVINGVSDTEFAPLENATRAQAAQILYNVLALIG